MKNVVGALALAYFSFAGFAKAQPANGNTAETCSPGCSCSELELTPLNIIAGHVPDKGEWMTGYSFMNTHFQGNQSGTSRLADEQVYRDYAMAPRTMDMQMHMAMVMYGVSTRFSVMAMFSYTACQMTMGMSETGMLMPGCALMTGSGNSARSASSGFGDTKIYGAYRMIKTRKAELIGNVGISLPSGTTDIKGTTMLGSGQRLAYCMQPGSGTFSLLPVVTYRRHLAKTSFGAEASAAINMGTNVHGYSYGNTVNFSTWVGRKVLPWLGLSARVAGRQTGATKGFDKDIAVLMYNDPTANAANYGGTTASTYIGFSCSLPKLRALNFRAELGVPVYQNLIRIQIRSCYEVQAGVMYAF